VLRVAIFVILVAACASPRTTSGNPAPERIVREFQVLVEDLASFGECEDPQRLVRFFAIYGVGYLEEYHLASILVRFELFGPLMVESQSAGQGLDFRLQAFYRKHSLSSQRDAMIQALKSWLTAPLDQGRRRGMMPMYEPGPRLRADIAMSRARAAEMLADWGEISAAPLIRACMREPELDPQAYRFFSIALGRLEDPCHGTMLRRNGAGRLEVCIDPDDRVTARWERSERRVDRKDLRRVLDLLESSVLADDSRAWAGRYVLVLESPDGIVAKLSPVEQDRVSYRDNASQNGSRKISIENPELHSLLFQLASEP